MYSIVNTSGQEYPSAPASPQPLMGQPIVVGFHTPHGAQSPINPYAVGHNFTVSTPIQRSPFKEEESFTGDGLQYLSTVDRLFIKQNRHAHEVIYTLKNKEGHNMYHAVKKTPGFWTKICCGTAGNYELKILDILLHNVKVHMRPVTTSCCWNSTETMEIFAPPDVLIGTVRKLSTLKPKFIIKNATGEDIIKIKGPFFTSDAEFSIINLDTNTTLGKISKTWSGISAEMFADDKFYGVSFPTDLDVKTKALLINSCFLIGCLYYKT